MEKNHKKYESLVDLVLLILKFERVSVQNEKMKGKTRGSEVQSGCT